MKTLTATWKDGRILPDEAGDWPDGFRLRIEPLDQTESLGIRDNEWSDTPEAIEAWIRWYDSLEPLEFTSEELAAWQSDREEQKKLELAQWEPRSERVERIFP